MALLWPQLSTGVASGLGALFSLRNIRQVGGNLALQSSGWANAGSLSGLKCVGNFAGFISNAILASLTGFETLTSVNYKGLTGASLLVTGSPALTAVGYSPLKTLARCVGTVSPLTASINATASIGTGCPRTATKYTGICQFATGSCVGVV